MTKAQVHAASESASHIAPRADRGVAGDHTTGHHSAGRATLLLTRADIAGLMTPADYLAAVEIGFRLSKQGRAPAPAPLHIPGIAGGFHAKGAALMGSRNLAALKLNGNFPGNPGRGLPTIQGVVLLCDADDGRVLAIMDSIEITLRRTAAATALAARHLARPDASVLAICGCGDQARAQAAALAATLPVARGLAWDIDADRAVGFAAEMSRTLGLRFVASASLAAAARAADVIVTCTTARTAFLAAADVSPGTFVAAVGADSPDKSEIAPGLMAGAKVVVDVLEQCLAMGDLRHAIAAAAMTAAEVHADLGDVVTGVRPGREHRDEIVVFDSTGTAIQDVASAAAVYEQAVAGGVGREVVLA